MTWTMKSRHIFKSLLLVVFLAWSEEHWQFCFASSFCELRSYYSLYLPTFQVFTLSPVPQMQLSVTGGSWDLSLTACVSFSGCGCETGKHMWTGEEDGKWSQTAWSQTQPPYFTARWVGPLTLWAVLSFLLCWMKILVAPRFTELSWSSHKIMCMKCLA